MTFDPYRTNREAGDCTPNEELRALVEQWRDVHAGPLREMGRLEESEWIECCADELEALIDE